MEAPLKEMLELYKDSKVWSLEMGLAFQFRKKIGYAFCGCVQSGFVGAYF